MIYIDISIYISLGEPQRNWVEPLANSLEKIVETMGKWFSPGEVGFTPAFTQLVT